MNFIKWRLLMVGFFPNILYTVFLYFLIGAIANLFNEISFYYQISIPIFIGAFTLIPIAIELKKSNFITRSMMEIAEITKWVFLMYGFLTLAIYLIEIAIKIPNEIITLLFLTIVPILAIYAYIKGHKIKIKSHELKIANLKEKIELIHISDLHIGSIRNKRLLKNIVAKINSTNADLVIISGDLADGTCPIDDNSFLAFKDSKVPIVFTPGNHDFYPGIENVISGAKVANVKVLFNEIFNFKGLQIIGLPFSFEETTTYGKTTVDNISLNDFNPNLPTVLVNHVPTNWTIFSKLGVDLQLSGHTHGGQFYPMVWLVKLVFPYLKGLFENDGKYLCVTSGIGTLGPPMRWGSDSEMILLKLSSLKQ
ncbi:MAG: metallophosphoesterase [Methanobrevibacter sp.]|nr:metallophosphoesterase [Methanobrevibacter sp.]